MGNYWAGYHGTGLVLNSKELEGLLAKYKELNPVEAEGLDEYIENYGYDEAYFVKSKYAGDYVIMPDWKKEEVKLGVTEFDKTMNFYAMGSNEVEGAMFWPFFRPTGRLNVMEVGENGERVYTISRALKEDDTYILWSDKDMESPRVFERPAYSSYEEFVQEFKDKVGRYLPEDFDWNGHLGSMSYACFA